MTLLDRDVPRVAVRDETDHRLRATFIDAMSRTAAPVTVVTTDGLAGRFGQTVSAATSVSADPPVLLVCLFARTPVAEAVYANGCFAVTVLSPQQRHISDSFAGRASSVRRYVFDDGWWPGQTSSPVRTDGAAAFDCELSQTVIAGTHAVFFGQVRRAWSNDVEGLTYRDRGYGVHQARPW